MDQKTFEEASQLWSKIESLQNDLDESNHLFNSILDEDNINWGQMNVYGNSVMIEPFLLKKVIGYVIELKVGELDKLKEIFRLL